MRDILFRGKRKDNEKWVEGYYAVKTICSIWNTYLAPVICLKPKGLYDDKWFEIIPSTIGQYTGLIDKNGKKIFEGDIVELFETFRGKVVNENGGFGICIEDNIDYDYLASEIEGITGYPNQPKFCENDNFISFWELMWNFNQDSDTCNIVKIIGNIHDNSELLKNT